MKVISIHFTLRSFLEKLFYENFSVFFVYLKFFLILFVAKYLTVKLVWFYFWQSFLKNLRFLSQNKCHFLHHPKDPKIWQLIHPKIKVITNISINLHWPSSSSLMDSFPTFINELPSKFKTRNMLLINFNKKFAKVNQKSLNLKIFLIFQFKLDD